MTTIAIAGATGAVGQQMLECLKERNIQANLKLLASARSKGKEIDGHIVEELTQESFQGVDYVLGATGNDITKMWMPWAKEAGCIVVDNSSAFRLDKDVPLVIPEVNKEDIKNHHGLIANPNCATIIALVALQALHKKYHIKRMIVTTFQAVSGAGVQGIEDLKNQIEDENIPSKAFPYQIAFNLIPQIGDFDDLGISKEEWKMQNEARKMWHDDALLKDDPKNQIYPMPKDTTNQDLVYVGRIRKDITDETSHTLSLFCCGDQIRKGAATNAVQILEELLKAND